MTITERHGATRGVEHPRPPEHVVHPIDPLSREGMVLDKVAKNIHSDFEGLFKGLHGSKEDLVRLTNVAKTYSFDLNRFWEYTRDSARNQYMYDKRSEKPWFEEMNEKLKETDEKLKSQLAKWEEVTSPYADHYQLDEIYNAAHELRRTIEGGLEKVKINVERSEKDPADKAKTKLEAQVIAALGGIAEQISSRLGALAAGKSAELITLSRQMQELLTRNAKDPIAERIGNERKETQELNKEIAKNDYSNDGLFKLLEQDLESALKLARNDLSADERRELEQKRDQAQEAIAALETALNDTKMPDFERRKMADARAEMTEAYKHLVRQTLTPDGFATHKGRWDLHVATLVSIGARYSAAAVKTAAGAAQKAQTRQVRYQQLIDDAKPAAGKDPAAHWRKVKGKFLDQVETVAGKELKETLNEAFKADLAQQLQDWIDNAKKTRLDPVKLQEIAASLSATITTYSERIEFTIRSESLDADPALARALQEAGDGMQASLTALRTTMTGKLQMLFDKGAFN